MSDVTYPLFPIVAFLGFILPLIPLRWHLQALNSGTCFFIFWSSLACLNQFINSVVWANNAINVAPAWCEISIRIMMGASFGIPASSLCINRRLYLISNVQTASFSLPEKRRAMLIDSIICFLFPLIYVALQYVVQGHRFNIFEQIGCYPALYNTLPAFFISTMWPLVLGLISLVYCTLTLRTFARRRVEFCRLLSQNSTFTVSRYFRLMGLAMTEICATTPLSIFVIWLNASATPVSPWKGWADTHFNYSRVEQFPAVVWRQNHLAVLSIEFCRWLSPLCSFIFFAFFGFTHETMKSYRSVWKSVTHKFGVRHSATTGDIKNTKTSTNASRKPAIPPAFPIHLKRADTIDSDLSHTANDKDYPLTPISSSTYTPSFEFKTSSPHPTDTVSLSRSMTL